MNKTIVYSINEYLIRAVESSYKKAKKDVVKNIRKYIVTGKTSQMVTGKSFNEKIFNDKNFSDKLPAYLSTDYSATDKKLLDNFRKEVFTVACVGTYDLEKKMKEIALEILELPESDTRDRKKLFVKESQDILSQYIPDGEKVPPAGWLKTNLQTAVNSSYNASQWVKLQDPAVKDLYPAYKYKTREDSHVRHEHAILNNSVYRSDDIIWKKIYPPNGWNCRCYINYLSAEDILEPGNNPNDLTTDPAEVDRLVKEAKIPPDFQRNSGMDGHIFDKWVRAKLKDMPVEAVKETKELVAEYVSILKAPNYGIEVKENIVPKNTKLSEYVKDIGVNAKLLETAEKNISTLRYSSRTGSYYEESTGLLNLDVTTHLNKLFKLYDVTHECSHIYHFKNKIINAKFVSEEFKKFYYECKDIFYSNYINKDLLPENYLSYRNGLFKNYDIEYGDYKLLSSTSGDIIASLTKGEYGIGHEPGYWDDIKIFQELFTGSSAIHFVGNNFMENEFPLLFSKTNKINKFYE